MQVVIDYDGHPDWSDSIQVVYRFDPETQRPDLQSPLKPDFLDGRRIVSATHSGQNIVLTLEG